MGTLRPSRGRSGYHIDLESGRAHEEDNSTCMLIMAIVLVVAFAGGAFFLWKSSQNSVGKALEDAPTGCGGCGGSGRPRSPPSPESLAEARRARQRVMDLAPLTVTVQLPKEIAKVVGKKEIEFQLKTDWKAQPQYTTVDPAWPCKNIFGDKGGLSIQGGCTGKQRWDLACCGIRPSSPKVTVSFVADFTSTNAGDPLIPQG